MVKKMNLSTKQKWCFYFYREVEKLRLDIRKVRGMSYKISNVFRDFMNSFYRYTLFIILKPDFSYKNNMKQIQNFKLNSSKFIQNEIKKLST